MPFEVKQILHNSCYSCHSNQTSLPWFDEVAPAYWLVTHDVKEGRKRLNFSEIGRLPVAQQKAVLFEAVNEIQLNAMPLPAYRLFHPESVITPQQMGMLKQYLRLPILNKATASTDRSAADGRINRGFRPTTPRQLYIRRQMESRLYLITRTKGRSVTSRTVDNHPMRVIRQ